MHEPNYRNMAPEAAYAAYDEHLAQIEASTEDCRDCEWFDERGDGRRGLCVERNEIVDAEAGEAGRRCPDFLDWDDARRARLKR